MPARPGSPALGAAIKLLSVRRLTKTRLAEKLRERGYASDAIADAVAECERRKYLDDRAFAQLQVRALLNRRPLGRYKLLQNLVRNGVDADVAAEVLDAVDESEDDRIDRALATLEMRFPHEGFSRLGRRLERQGFGAPVIMRALRRRAAAGGTFPEDVSFEEHA